MDKSDNQFHNDFRLRKREILRGFNSYLKVLKSSDLISTNFLKAFVNHDNKEKTMLDLTSESNAFGESPLFTNNVKVGFVVAKKKIRKAILRNRIRRLLKESYRLNKDLFGTIDLQVNIIFSITDMGYKIFEEDSKTKFEVINREMKLLAPKINNLLNTK